jgi:hypothetical protein
MIGNPNAAQSAPAYVQRSQGLATLACINQALTIMQALPQNFLLFDTVFPLAIGMNQRAPLDQWARGILVHANAGVGPPAPGFRNSATNKVILRFSGANLIFASRGPRARTQMSNSNAPLES